MQAFIGFVVSRVGGMVTFLSGLELVPGVSLLGFLAALFIIGVLIRSFLLVGK